ncbi:Uncharacterized protein EC-HemX [hydrothermal vent metagenome]|uniref:Uncharacterized protein EC-HemX n=1 Tax=hydrothermal vent metagenome TaxID=652676 RepID=A0A3B1B8Q5_9ZZZZ
MTDKQSNQSPAEKNSRENKKSSVEKQTSPTKEATADSGKNTGKTKSSTPATSRSRPSRGKTPLAGFSSLIIFVLFIAVIGSLVYWIEKQQKELAINSRYQIDQLRVELAPALVELKSSSHDIQARLIAQEKNQQDLNEAFSNLLKTRRHLRNDWLLAEADYLLRIANHRLLLAADTGSALAAMKTADERLHDMSDPAVIPVRNMLAEDINKLKAVPDPDIAGLSASLSALAHGVDGLPLLSEYVNSKTDTEQKPKNTKVENWKQLPDAIWNDMKKLLVIRERHGRVVPLLSPEQHFFLRQNLKLKLEQARLALLNAEQAVYEERLLTASEWIKDFFKADDPATIAMQEQLQQLVTENIKPVLPDISASYRALQDFREQQMQSSRRSGDAS